MSCGSSDVTTRDRAGAGHGCPRDIRLRYGHDLQEVRRAMTAPDVCRMIVAAALSRLLPHPPNFSPVEAMALFGGAYFASRAWAVAVPLLAMLLSDLVMAAMLANFPTVVLAMSARRSQ